ncbi:MAG: LysR family transcriptional regulator [Cytophagales bacterium]
MNYTLHQLQIFVVVADNSSITKASDQLHMTQPAVSIQLKKLQDNFDIPLYEVIGRKLYLTDFGKEFLEISRSILNEVKQIDYKTKAFKGLLTGKLKIACVSTSKYVIPYFLSDFLKQNPHVDLNLEVTNKTQVLRALERNEMDFCVVSLLPTEPEIEKITLLSNHLYLVANQNFDEEVDDISKIPLVFREEGSGTRQTMEHFFEEQDIKPKVKLELLSNETVKQAVIAGLGYSILPLVSIKNELATKTLKIVEYKKLPIATSWQLIWHKNKKLSPVSKAFLEHLETNKNDILKKHFSWLHQYRNE